MATKRFKSPEELEDFIEKLETANKGLSDDVKKLKEQLKKLRSKNKSDIDNWFYGNKEEEEEEEDENKEN
jgi:hypothetical protein